MKPKNTYLSILIFLLVLLISCKDDAITELQYDPEVIVKVSNINYNQNLFNTFFPDTSSLRIISVAFSENYSEKRKEKLIENMRSKIIKASEDIGLIDNILLKAGCTKSGEYILPTYVERAHYDGKDAWLVQFTYGLSAPKFGHFKCFAFSIPSLDTLNYLGCR